MRSLLWNFALTLVWTFATGQFTIANFVLGFGLAFCVLYFSQSAFGASTYYARVGRLLRFALFYLGQLVMANLRVAYDVLTPTFHMRPGILAIPLDAKTDEEITLLANLISLTPGTLCLSISDDRRTMLIHDMYIDAPAAARRRLKEGLERRVLELMR